jgi:hypothetical protein
MLEIKEALNGQAGRQLIHKHRVYCGEVVLQRGSPGIELEPQPLTDWG